MRGTPLAIVCMGIVTAGSLFDELKDPDSNQVPRFRYFSENSEFTTAYSWTQGYSLPADLHFLKPQEVQLPKLICQMYI